MSHDSDPMFRRKNITVFSTYRPPSDHHRLRRLAKETISKHGEAVVPFIRSCYGPLMPVDIPALLGQSYSWLFRSADGPNILVSYADLYPLPATDECFTLIDPATLSPEQARQILHSQAKKSGPLFDWEIADVELAHIEVSGLSDEEACERIKRGWTRPFFDLSPTLETWKRIQPSARETLDAVVRGENYAWLYVKNTIHYEVMGTPKSITHWWPLEDPFWVFANRFSSVEVAHQYLVRASLIYQDNGCYRDQEGMTYRLKDSYPAWSKVRKRSVRTK